MARHCRTCETPDAEAALLAGESYLDVAERFGISDQALRNHMKNHVEHGRVATLGADLDAWRAFCGEMYDALAPWPEARQAAADRLRAFIENAANR